MNSLDDCLASTFLTRAKSPHHMFASVCLCLGYLADVRTLSGRGVLYVQNVSNPENIFSAVDESRAAEIIADSFVFCISHCSHNNLPTPFFHRFQHTAVSFRKVVTTLLLHYLKGNHPLSGVLKSPYMGLVVLHEVLKQKINGKRV